MTQKIQLRRGTAADLPTGGTIEGEPRFTTDTGRLYIDDGSNNVLIGGTDASSINVLDAKGDILYASAANTIAALNIGSASQVLTVNTAGDAPEWKDPSSYVSDTSYASSWDNVTTVAPSKNAVYDKVQTLMALTGANLAIGSDADGDMYYRASSVLARLAKGTANYKLFMNAGATAPEWSSGIYVGTFTRAMDATGAPTDVSYTGLPFKPSALIIFSSLGNASLSAGIADSSHSYVQSVYGGATTYYDPNDSNCIWIIEQSGKEQKASLKTFDSNGFTLTWTKVGSPESATAQNYYIAFR
jgi:hypothetical protein